MDTQNVLFLIQSSDATVYTFKMNGLWDRQKSTLEFYARSFKVYYYTSDWKSYQDDMPANVIHKVGVLKSEIFGLRHILFYLYLIHSSFTWRNKFGVIRVFGVTLPVLKLVKLFSLKKIVISYQYDWAEQTRKNYKNIKHYVARWVERSSMDSADFIICTMKWLYDKAINVYKKDARQTAIIPNYVDLEHFYPEEKEKLIVFAGRLHWSKGVDTLIKAFTRFAENNTDYKLLIFGGGEEKDNLIELANWNLQIKFMGATPINIYAQTLRKAEVFVLPTVTMEGHPKALIEAMAAGCKCIASDVAGNIDVFTEADYTVGLFKAKDENALFEKLLDINNLDISITYNFAVKNYSKTILLEREVQILNAHIS